MIFNCNVFSALHAKHFEIWKNISWNWWVDYSIARSIKWCDILGVYSESIFPFMQYFFLSRKLCFLRSPCLLLIAESISLDTSGKPTVGFFLKISSSSWIILSISLNELNSSDWLLKRWWWIFLKQFLFYCCKRILIWQKILEVFLRIHLNIIFWILLWVLTPLVIWNLNITVSTTLKYCYT